MKTVLITGASRGIGAACVKKFATENYNVVFLYKSNDTKAEELRTNFQNVTPIKCDVTNSKEVTLAISEIKEKFGGIHVLVNNAGVSYSGVLQNMTDDDWYKVLDTNLSSMFFLSREVIPMMLNQGEGSIVNVSSMWGITGASCEVAYSTSKAGVIGFTKALAKELAPSKIRVNAVAPGAIDTDMLKGYTKEELSIIADETPLGTIGKCEDIAEAVYFLSSEKAGFITGEVLNVNGGFVI
ncbi:MAG: SDR family oxidoreductase [Ruminococcaceae bacterium]|nr:SDR family oxidoreductase [Oscillospiraceae bacterium]